ncbi:MAG TPA: insulinase family protein [Candidatus Saccharimonadales bacterium]
MRHSVSRLELPSGASGLLVDVSGSTVVDMEFTFLSGFEFVERSKYEVPHSMEHMIFGANDTFKNAQLFSREIGLNGAYHNAYTSNLLNGYVAETAEFEWDRVMSLFWYGLTTPKFLKKEFLTEQETVKEELYSRLDNHSLMLDVALGRTMGDDHMQDYRTRIRLLAGITTDDLISHHQLTHNAANMRFIICGNLRGKKDKVARLLQRFTAQLPAGDRRIVPQSNLIQPLAPVTIEKAADKVYFDLKAGFYGELNERELVGLRILRHLLTEAWDSRIFGKGRTKGLLYGISSSGGSAQGISGFNLTGSVVKSKYKALFEFLADELCRLKDKGVTPAELKRAKQHQIGEFQTRHQTAHSLTNWYSRVFTTDDYYDFKSRPDLIKSITRRDINYLVERFFHDAKWGVGVLADKAGEISTKLYDQAGRVWG